MRTGTANLPLHGGRAPRWLFERMTRLAREIMCYMASEFGSEQILNRMSDPFWFQALGCVLGFDWHSSGVTTTTCGAIKQGIKGLEDDLGFYAAGGKGKTSRRTPGEIEEACEHLSIDACPLTYASRMSAKVDSAALQDGFQVYQHAFFFTPAGQWCVVQQGMNDESGMARRYHWLGDRVQTFVNEPHSAVCCDLRGQLMLNFVAEESADMRQRAAEIASQPVDETLGAVDHLPLLDMPRRHQILDVDMNPKYLRKVLLKTYDQAPRNFEGLLGVAGVGPKTLRALAMVAELMYGTKTSTRDPARFSFAHGGKDGIPYPVDRATYDGTIDIFHNALNKAGIDHGEKVAAFKRLAMFADIEQAQNG
jgi:hypothetical protein